MVILMSPHRSDPYLLGSLSNIQFLTCAKEKGWIELDRLKRMLKVLQIQTYSHCVVVFISRCLRGFSLPYWSELFVGTCEIKYGSRVIDVLLGISNILTWQSYSFLYNGRPISNTNEIT